MSKPILPPSADVIDALELVRSGQWDLNDYKEWDEGRIMRTVWKGKPPPVRFAVSKKGAVSVYNLQRLPITLYANQWRKLAEHMPQLLAFLDAHENELAIKEPKPHQVAADEVPASEGAA